MKAICVIPKNKDSLHLRDVPVPNLEKDELLIRSIHAGICSTDREICEGLYGTPPVNKEYLVLGHESCGVVERVGNAISGFSKGEYVVRLVRRPCNTCYNCETGANDMCSTGNFVETGIKGLEGCMSEYFTDTPKYLVKVPSELIDVSVLLEPLSVVEKALRQTRLIQERLKWKPKTAMVIGAGPIGILQSMLLTEQDIETYVVARSPYGNLKSQIVTNIGGRYICSATRSLEEISQSIGNPDFIVEASGDSKMAFEAMNILGNNGVLCLTGVTGGNKKVTVPSDKINLNIVLGNNVIFGTVNANYIDYCNGILSLERFERKWPGVLHSMLTRKVKLENYPEAFKVENGDIKTIIEM